MYDRAREEYRETVATVAGQVAEAFTSAMAVAILARDVRQMLHGHPDEQPLVATVDLSRLDLEQDSESAST
jgi:hypothetical protein